MVRLNIITYSMLAEKEYITLYYCLYLKEKNQNVNENLQYNDKGFSDFLIVALFREETLSWYLTQ